MSKASKSTLIRVATIPLSLEKLLENQLRFMSSYYKVIAVSSDKERLERFGKKEEVNTYDLEMTREITPFQDFKVLIRLTFFLIKEKPLIVHTHTPKAGIVGMLASWIARVPLRLHTVAGLPLMEARGTKRRILEYVEKLTYFCASRVYPNSTGLKDFIVENHFCSPRKLKIIGDGSSNGIDTDYFDKRHFPDSSISELKEELNIPVSDTIFVFVGRMVGDKGVNELVSAFMNMLEINKNITLLLVGPMEEDLDPLRSDTIAKIKDCPKIISTGFMQDVRPYLSISDVFVFPSYREGFPNVVLQAGAMDLPCIATDINGCNEIIKNDFNGILIPSKNTKAVFDSMRDLLEDVSKRKRLSSNSRENIVKKYKRDVFWSKMLDEYKALEEGLNRI